MVKVEDFCYNQQVKKSMLIILDGFGEAPRGQGNAVAAAYMPFFKKLRQNYPLLFLRTDGNASGLPEGQTGASEPGHFVIGAGRRVWQPLEEINQTFAHDDIFEKTIFKDFLQKCRDVDKVHLMGLLSDGGVHSHIDHLLKFIDMLHSKGVKNIYIHCFADGRDVHERSIQHYLKQIINKPCKIASLIGRYYAMDRDQNFERTEVAFRLLTEGVGELININDLENNIYLHADTDYYLPAFKFADFQPISKHEPVLFFNFRSDRAQQLTSAFCQPEFDYFSRNYFFNKNDQEFIVFGPYDLGNAWNLFPPSAVVNNLGEWWSKHQVKQLRIAETEKFAHVTFFFNSQNKDPYPGEDRIMINSPKVPSYDLKPEMSALELTEKVCEQIERQYYQAIVLNFANADLVGHSGKFEAAKKACECLDQCLSRIVPLAIDHDYSLIITADHGNSDKMLFADGSICPAHSENPVPCLLIESSLNKVNIVIKGQKNAIPYHGELADIAPTMLKMMNLPIPAEMTGKIL